MKKPKTMHISAPEPLPIPPEVRFFAKPLVAVGDMVKVGQLIGEAWENGLPVHASVSGKVKAIDDFEPITGEKVPSIVINSDGEQTLVDTLTPPVISNKAEFLNALKNSGAIYFHALETDTPNCILVNAVESEPFVTSDARTLIDNAEDILECAALMMKHLTPKQLIICIGDNNPEALEKMKAKPPVDGISIRSVSSKYPQGQDTVLVHKVIGRNTDTSYAVINSTALSVMAKYIKTGMPYTHRIVTVAGSAVKTPKNLVVPLGTAIKHLFDYCGGLTDEATEIIMGGPMTGNAVPSFEMHTAKAHNAVLALNEKDSEPALETACIKCGRCISGCPINLMPSFIEGAYEQKNTDMLNKLKVNLCIECGYCAYLCPAKRPLAQVMSLSKIMQKNIN